MDTITWSYFERLELRVGRIVSAEMFPEARKPYQPEELAGRPVVAVVNFPATQIGPLMSECLVTGFHNEHGHVALCVPDREVPLGTKLS